MTASEPWPSAPGSTPPGEPSAPWPQRPHDARPGGGAAAPASGAWAPQPGEAWGPPPPTPSRFAEVPASRHERPWWGLGDVFLGLAIYILASLVLGFAAVVITLVRSPNLSQDQLTADLTNSAALIVAGGVVSLLAFGVWPYVVSRWKGFRSLKADFAYWFRWIDLLIGLGAAIVAFLLLGLLNVAQEAYNRATNSNVQTTSNSGFLDANRRSWVYLVLAVVVAVVAPLVEELFFRGLTYSALAKRWNPAAAVIGSTVLFAVLHFQTDDTFVGGVLLVANIFLVGLVLGLLRFWTGRCGAGVVAHVLFNGTAVVATLFA